MSNGEDKAITELGDTWGKLLDAIKHPKKRTFLQAYAQCGKVGESAEVVKVSRVATFFWRKDDKLFKEAFDIAQEIYNIIALEKYEAELEKRSLDPRAPMSSVLLMFKLKSLADKYRDKMPTMPIVGDITIKLAIPERKYPELKEGGTNVN